MSQYKMTISGKPVDSRAFFDVVNPATEEKFAKAPDCTKEQLDDAVESAEAAFNIWGLDEAARRSALKNCGGLIHQYANELGELLTREQGRTIKDTVNTIHYAGWWFEQVAGLEIPVDVLQDGAAARVELHRKPAGVIGAITPWNFPILMAVWKIAPGLLAGNTMVLKPSPFTPLATLRMGEILQQTLPPGVLNVVSGGNELGAWMTRHPGIRRISFTGSIETGKKIAQAIAPDLKKAILELGGNDAAIVLPDVDVDTAAEGIFRAAFGSCGQVCMAIKRLYVHEDIFEPLTGRLVEIAKGIKLGDGLKPDTDMGPLCNKPQLERVIELVEYARKNGGKILVGGERPKGPGFFYPPTIITGLSQGARLVDEEQFGPVLPVIAFKDVEDALRQANSLRYGLGGSIWTKDMEKGTRLASRLECGTAWVNTHFTSSPFVPFGGIKWSGIGMQNGRIGLDELCDLQVRYMAKPQIAAAKN